MTFGGDVLAPTFRAYTWLRNATLFLGLVLAALATWAGMSGRAGATFGVLFVLAGALLGAVVLRGALLWVGLAKRAKSLSREADSDGYALFREGTAIPRETGRQQLLTHGWLSWDSETITVTATEDVMMIPREAVRRSQRVEVARGWAYPRIEVQADEVVLRLELLPRSGVSWRGASVAETRLVASILEPESAK